LAFFRGWTRRDVLRLSAGSLSLAAGAWLLKRVYLPRRLNAAEVATFSAFVDTLIPDSEFPGARRTGVVEPLLAECQRERRRRRALVEGMHWLDREARRQEATPFARLEPATREQIVADLARQEKGSVPHFLYRTVRDRALQLHYAHPAVWKTIGFPHPPQPRGYTDYWKRPDA